MNLTILVRLFHDQIPGFCWLKKPFGTLDDPWYLFQFHHVLSMFIHCHFFWASVNSLDLNPLLQTNS